MWHLMKDIDRWVVDADRIELQGAKIKSEL